MKKIPYQALYFTISAIIITLLLFAGFKWQLSFNPYISIIVTIAIICVLIIGFLIYVSIKSSKDDPFPLGLPTGSVRALIAVLVLIFFILLSTAFVFYAGSLDRVDLIKDILKTLGTLLIAVSAFYFGSKATEQGGKIVKDAFNDGVKSQNEANEAEDVPVEIIEEAIKANIESWKATYKCDDIKAGKKETNSVSNNLNCILFIVTVKGNPAPEVPPIPPTILYNSKGKNYKIPTDVKKDEAQTAPQRTLPNDTGDPAARNQQPPEMEIPVEIDINQKSQTN